MFLCDGRITARAVATGAPVATPNIVLPESSTPSFLAYDNLGTKTLWTSLSRGLYTEFALDGEELRDGIEIDNIAGLRVRGGEFSPVQLAAPQRRRRDAERRRSAVLAPHPLRAKLSLYDRSVPLDVQLRTAAAAARKRDDFPCTDAESAPTCTNQEFTRSGELRDANSDDDDLFAPVLKVIKPAPGDVLERGRDFKFTVACVNCEEDEEVTYEPVSYTHLTLPTTPYV